MGGRRSVVAFRRRALQRANKAAEIKHDDMSIKAIYFGLSVFFKQGHPWICEKWSFHLSSSRSQCYLLAQTILCNEQVKKVGFENSEDHAEIRSLPSHPHSHLKMVYITGFYGQKDQLELALYILRNSVRLKSMKINPKPIIAEYLEEVRESEEFFFLDGYQVALKFLCKEDRCNVVDVKEVRLSVIESAPDLAKLVQYVSSSWQKTLASKEGKKENA